MTREIKKLDKNIFELKCSAFKGEGYTLWKLRKNWELIAGDIIAEKSEPKNLYMRELTVYVYDPVIHHSIVSYSSIIMKKINEFFQGNVVEKVEVRKINKNLRKNVLDFSQKEKSEKISEINEKKGKKVLFHEEEQELSFEEREKIRENIEKIDKKYENFAIRLKEIAENNRKKETVKKTVENSLCYFAYDTDKNKLIGFARAITDYTTNYYICDVIVDEEYRGEGIGKKLVETLINDEELIQLRGLLITKDAKKFYEKFGFYNKEDVMQKDKK